MEEKEFEKISDRCLILCYDLVGRSKKKSEVVELLVQDVFEQIPTENFSIICNDLRRNIGSLTQEEKDTFEEALEFFLRKFFKMPK
ncbi:hypothetical protein [Aliarcobacter butzleri]|uniref:hypothetical protein n=1 Tax=Aliarcobacter butzleri TaxID=28197 RepID=UPI003AF9A204